MNTLSTRPLSQIHTTSIPTRTFVRSLSLSIPPTARDPLVLPDGISASDDPLLAARSAVYSRSFTRRAEEPKTPSAVNVSRVLR